MKKIFILIFIFVLVFAISAQGKKLVIKTATLVPKGTTWYQVLEDIASDWAEITDDQIELRIYPGGVVGDEEAMVRKMRIGQIQAAAMSSHGLQYIHKSVYGLNFPMMIRNWDEFDWLREKLEDDIIENLRQEGFEHIFWADVGWVYWFSTVPIIKPEDAKNLKLFTRATDFTELKLWKIAGFNPVPLTVSDVLPGLQTGLIQVIDAPAFMVLSSQWFGLAKHCLNVKWAAMTGAMVISNRAWNQIPEQYHQKLKDAARERCKLIQDELRYQSDQALEVMKKYGLIVHDVDSTTFKEWEESTFEYYPKFKDVLVPPETYEKVMDLMPELKEYRSMRQKNK